MPPLRHHSRGLRVLTAVAISLWLVSMAGSTVVLCVFPRFLPAARAARVESGRNEGDPARRGPTNEELINREGVLIFAAGQAIWVIAALGAVSSVGMLVTIVLSAFGHRVLSQQLQELRAGNGSGPPAVTGDFMATPEKRTDKTRVLLLRILPGIVLLVGIGAIGSYIIQNDHRAKLLHEDSVLVERMAQKANGAIAVTAPGQSFSMPALELEMIWVGPGSLEMGGKGKYDGQPATKVKLSNGFWLGKYELERDQYEMIMHERPPGSHRGKNLPSENISWFAAMEFCRKLTDFARAAGRLPEGYVFSLPTEAQWEYACRAGSAGGYVRAAGATTRHFDDIPAAFPWTGGLSGSDPQPVGQSKPNAWGFFDMFDNNEEWCLDFYALDLPGGNVIDPAGPSSGDFRVVRGGLRPWSTFDSRRPVSPYHWRNGCFRVALVPR